MASNRRTSTSHSTSSRASTSAATNKRADTSTDRIGTSSNRVGTSNQVVGTSNPFATTSYENATTTTRPRTAGGRSAAASRPGTARPRTGISTLGIESQEIICAVSESRGISPTVGLAFINLDNGEAVLCQISDSQTYVRTIHKLMVFNPSFILMMSTASNPKSKLFSIIEESLVEIGSNLVCVDRRYWAETTGLENIQDLAFSEEVGALKVAVGGNYYAVCCFACVLKYVELGLEKTFPYHSLRIRYETSEGSMMIDMATIQSLELVQNLQNPKSRDSLFGLLNETLTPMGSRLLRSNILQPLTDTAIINSRYEAVEELATKEEMFYTTRDALKGFLDADKILTAVILIPTQPDIQYTMQSVNNVIMLKQFVNSIKPVFEALTGARSGMLESIRTLCASEGIVPIQQLIDSVINEGTAYASQPLDMRNQRTYAVKSGVNGLLDVARQTYKESMTDAFQHVAALSEQHDIKLDSKFDNVRQFYIRLSADELEDRELPPIFINVFRKKNVIECQTLDLMKLNQKLADSHTEVVLMSDKMVQQLIVEVRGHMSVLFKVCEGIAMLDMLSSFAQLVTSREYVRPLFTETLAIRAGRHPIREKVQSSKFIPNDVYATQQTRFQVITGCNMSGKSTYIRSIALMSVMAQIGSFVPAEYAAFPVIRQLFARISMDDSIEANVSTFASEMGETAFILRNIDRQSMVIIDELGRGTSTRDGLAIAIAIAEALIESRALVWFVTHFRDLASIMAERNGVVNHHLAVDMSESETMHMLYRIAPGAEQQDHYGLELAKVVPLPADVLAHAYEVSKTLELQMKNKKKTSLAIIHSRRRKLILNLKEHLIQAKNGAMDDVALTAWLKALQKEFVIRMTAIDEQARLAEMDEQSEHDAEDAEIDRPVTRGTDRMREQSEAVSEQRNGSSERGAGAQAKQGSLQEQIRADNDREEHFDATSVVSDGRQSSGRHSVARGTELS